MLNKVLHYFAHLFGCNVGKVITFEEDGMICVAFKCDYCGEIDEKMISKVESNLVIKKESEIIYE